MKIDVNQRNLLKSMKFYSHNSVNHSFSLIADIILIIEFYQFAGSQAVLHRRTVKT